MIYPVILDHEKSRRYTDLLVSRLEDYPYEIIDSTYLKTQFTESFNIGLIKGYSYCLQNNFDHIMICNNDISLTKNNLLILNDIIKKQEGIFSPSCNSPHRSVMNPIDNNDIRKVPWVEFICPIIHKNIIKNIGILDLDMRHGWGVEVDYCYRASLREYQTFLVQSCEVQHYEHQSQDDHSKYCDIANHEMNYFLMEKYGPNWHSLLQYPQF